MNQFRSVLRPQAVSFACGLLLWLTSVSVYAQVVVAIWSTQISEILTSNPVLSITVSNANAVVSWPGTAITFNLESNTNLLAANGWTVVTPNFSTNNGQVYYQTSLTNGARFFRLHKP